MGQALRCCCRAGAWEPRPFSVFRYSHVPHPSHLPICIPSLLQALSFPLPPNNLEGVVSKANSIFTPFPLPFWVCPPPRLPLLPSHAPTLPHWDPFLLPPGPSQPLWFSLILPSLTTPSSSQETPVPRISVYRQEDQSSENVSCRQTHHW